MRSRLTVFLAFLVCFFAAADPGHADRKQIAPVPQSGEQIRSELGLSGSSGWMLVDLDTGEVLDQSNADRGFAPASVAKLPTAAFALDALGPDHRFTTEIVGTGPVVNGRLQGDLILKGGGDPELDTDALMPMVTRLREQGITGIDGRFGVDATALPQIAEIEPPGKRKRPVPRARHARPSSFVRSTETRPSCRGRRSASHEARRPL